MHNMYSTAYINVCFCVVFSLSSIYCLFFFLSFSYSTLLLVFAYSTIEINYRNPFYFLLRFPSLFLSVLKWTENFRADFNIKGVALRLPIPIYWISEEEQQVNFGSRKKKGISRRVEKNITSFRHQRHEESKTYAQRLLNIENVCCHCLIKGMCVVQFLERKITACIRKVDEKMTNLPKRDERVFLLSDSEIGFERSCKVAASENSIYKPIDELANRTQQDEETNT